MLLCLASEGAVKEGNPFDILTRQLLNKNPLRRRSLWSWDLFAEVRSLSERQGRAKRKRDVLPHHAKRLAIGPV